jgi:hypothetical protein
LNPGGPLFEGPAGAHGISWLAILSLVVALAAIALLVFRLVRDKVPPPLAVAGLLLPVAAYGLGSMFVLEESKSVEFCGSCHVMTPVVKSVQANDGSLASLHYAHGRIRYDHACYTCHSGYGIWGTFDAKLAGLRHMLHTVTGRYEVPITIRAPFDIDSCLGCHAHAASFRAVEAHQDPDLQKQLVTREMSCTGICHPGAHPEDVLTKGVGG